MNNVLIISFTNEMVFAVRLITATNSLVPWSITDHKMLAAMEYIYLISILYFFIAIDHCEAIVANTATH